MQLATLQELSFDEIDQVSGAGLFSFVGDAIVDVVKVSNDLLNTSVISSVGKVFNAVGLTPSINWPTPSATAWFKGVAAVGGLLGGDTSRIDYHYDTGVDLIPGPRPAPVAERASTVAGDPDAPGGDLGPGNREGATSAPIRRTAMHDPIQQADAFVGDPDSGIRRPVAPQLPRQECHARRGRPGGRLDPGLRHPARRSRRQQLSGAGRLSGRPRTLSAGVPQLVGKSPPTTSGAAPRAPTKRFSRWSTGPGRTASRCARAAWVTTGPRCC